jgi:sulfur carrier protein
MTTMTGTIRVRVNGEERELQEGLTVAQLLEALSIPPSGTAIELAGTIVPHSSYDETRLEDGQAVEIVRFVGGG